MNHLVWISGKTPACCHEASSSRDLNVYLVDISVSGDQHFRESPTRSKPLLAYGRLAPTMEPSELTANSGVATAVEWDELLHWEIRVARRADELASRVARGRDEDLRYWLQAEEEVWSNAGGAQNRN